MIQKVDAYFGMAFLHSTLLYLFKVLKYNLNSRFIMGENYAASLVSTICSEDVELCAACMKSGEKFLENPSACIEGIISSGSHDDGTPYYFGLDGQRLNNIIWECQIAIIFPALERYRNKFIQRYRKDITQALPIESTFGETIAAPEDAELGVLYHLTSEGWIVMKTNNEFSNLRKLKEARNSLAHLRILDFETVKLILSEARQA